MNGTQAKSLWASDDMLSEAEQRNDHGANDYQDGFPSRAATTSFARDIRTPTTKLRPKVDSVTHEDVVPPDRAHLEARSALGRSEWPRVDLPALSETAAGHDALKNVRLSGVCYTSQIQIDELNARIRRMATNMRFIDPENDVKLQVEEDPEENRVSHQGRRIFDSTFNLSEIPVLAILPEAAPEPQQDVPITVPADTRSLKQTTFPGIQAEPMRLPYNVSARKIIARAMQGCRANRRIRQKLLLPETESITCDFFWYMFLKRTQPSAQAERDALFARLSSTYVHILLQTNSRDRDDLSFIFTGVISSAVYTSFCECFSDSSKEFDSEFQVEISDLLSEWIIGMRPTFANGWKTATSLTGLRRSMSSLNRDMSNTQEQNFLDLMGGGDGSSDPSRNVQASIPSAYIGSVAQTRRVLFDANGNSRVIERYLGKTERRIINIHRTESLRESADHGDRQTYRQVVSESIRRSKNLQRNYKAAQESAQREKMRLLQSLNEQLRHERQRITKILARPENVRDTADQIMDLAIENRQQAGIAAGHV
ncbi:hypothetical protein DFJ77DRAFT_548914 [Powellomyces hirtus]|nr:hypothetical protein DFJ77DRAFT_548914 [Powellomyces hirtus]